MLGIVRKLSFVPASLGRLNVIPTADYESDVASMKNHLHILLNEEDLNLDLQITRYCAETINRVRWTIKEGNAMLMFGFLGCFLQFLVAKGERQLLGSTLGLDGSFGGR